MPASETKENGVRFTCPYSGNTPEIVSNYKDAYVHYAADESGSNAVCYVDPDRTPESTMSTIADNYTLDPSITGDVDVFLTAGQSDARGKGDSTASPDVASGTAHEFTGSGLVTLDDPVGDTTATEANSGSAWPAFAVRYNAATNREVVFVPEAVGGAAMASEADTGNGFWEPGVSGSLYPTAKQHVNDCLTWLSNNGYSNPQFRGVLWHQGETDADQIRDGVITQDQFKTAMQALVDQFHTDFRSDLPFYAAYLGRRQGGAEPNTRKVRGAQKEIVAENDYAIAAFKDCYSFARRGLQQDTWHFTQPGYDEMGRVMASRVAGNVQ